MRKTVQALFFLFLLFIFSISLPNFFKQTYGNINPSRDIVSKPQKKKIYRTKYSLYTIKAMDKERWVYFSFSEGRTVNVNDHTVDNWDIAFQRANFISNGGATNSKGNVGIINFGNVDIDTVNTAPISGYIQDSSWFGLNRNKELNKWYNYKTRYHTLNSKMDVYVIRTSMGKYLKMRIIDYYCESGESACITIEYFFQPNGSRDLNNFNEIITTKTILTRG